MLRLLIRHRAPHSDGRYDVSVTLESDGYVCHSHEAVVRCEWTTRQSEDLRWYLEDYKSFPLPPAPNIARRIEGELQATGERLFADLFPPGAAATMWDYVRGHLNSTDIVIENSAVGVDAIPWELLRDPAMELPIALSACSFVRRFQADAAAPVGNRGRPETPLRILLVISRPGGEKDVRFRVVSRHLLESIDRTGLRGRVRIECLRPPTFNRLQETLRLAHESRAPYDVVHFDGHGFYAKRPSTSTGKPTDTDRDGNRGFLVFEGDHACVDGTTVGQLLQKAGARALLVNACRSGHVAAESHPRRRRGSIDGDDDAAWGSFAHEVLRTGLPVVLAMRYDVSAETAALFYSHLYDEWLSGSSLGRSATDARRTLARRRARPSLDPVHVQDWLVPVVYEQGDVFAAPTGSAKDASGMHAAAVQGRSMTARDGTVLALDRALDNARIVLLQGEAGAGKTLAATDFADWYIRTGGASEAMITTFEPHTTLKSVLQEYVAAHPDVELGISAILKDIRSRHIIWVWDSVEPLTGFPLGEHAVASDADIHELKAFLAHAVESSVRFVLTSRRSEPELLGGLAAQEVGLMPMTEDEERVVIHQVLDVEAPLRVPETWYPLMVFSGGNPLVLSNITTAVLRRQLVRDEEIKSFLEDARSGALEWDIAGDRRTSVSASLAWGFEAAFIGRDLQRIAVLHLFRSTVFTSVLELMGSSDVDWHVPELRGTSRLEWTDLLGRAERLGVLQGFGSTELYRLHGGTQWFLRKAFLQLDAGMAKAAKRAYAEAIGVFGNMLLPTMQAGGLDTSTLSASIGENFVHARRLALDHGWWLVAIGCMNALKAWFNQPMFSAYWKSLVRETAAYYLNLETLAPHSGLEDYWEAIVQMLVDVAETAEERSFLLERRQHSLDVDLQTFRDANNSRMVSWASDAVRLNRAQVLSERLSQGDLTVREELLRLYEQAQARGPATEAAALAFELGRVALWVQKPPAPSEAVKWYRIAAERCSEPQMKARCLNELGAALRKQSEATADRAEIAALQKAAFAAYREALSVGSENHLERWVAEAHERLGRLHQDCLEFSEALRHFQIALDSHVRQNDDLRVAILQMDIAAVEINTGNFVNAKERLAHALPEFRKRGRADLIEFATETLKRIHASERFS